MELFQEVHIITKPQLNQPGSTGQPSNRSANQTVQTATVSKMGHSVESYAHSKNYGNHKIYLTYENPQYYQNCNNYQKHENSGTDQNRKQPRVTGI